MSGHLSSVSIAMLLLNTFTHDARVYKEAKTLTEAGYQVTVFAIKDSATLAEEIRDGIEIRRIDVSSRKWGRSLIARLAQVAEYLWKTARSVQRTKPDIIHAHDVQTLFLAWVSSRLCRAILIYDSHEFERGRNWGHSNLPPIFRRFWTLPESLFIRSAALVITVSQSIAEELVKNYHISCPMVLLNAPEHRLSRASNILRQELSIPEDKTIILYQGVIGANRGLRTLISGTMLVPDTVIVLLGDGPLHMSIHKWVQQQEWAHRVYMPGRVPLEELLDYTAAADIGVALIQNACLSYYYCLPNKLFEYMQAGLPIISSNFPEMQQVVKQNKIGLVVDPESPEEFAQALHTLLEQPKLREQMATNARLAANHYNWDIESAKLLSAYEQLQAQKQAKIASGSAS